MYSRFCDATTLPLLADADTGFGNVTNVARAVRLYEKAGVAGPVHRGPGVPQALRPHGRQGGDRRRRLARKDQGRARRARGPRLRHHGAHRRDRGQRRSTTRSSARSSRARPAPTCCSSRRRPTWTQMRRICAEVPGPCLANNVETGLSPLLPAAELQAIGYAAVVFPVAATYAVAHALRELFATLRRTGTTADAAAAARSRSTSSTSSSGCPAQRRARGRRCRTFADALVARHAATRRSASPASTPGGTHVAALAPLAARRSSRLRFRPCAAARSRW